MPILGIAFQIQRLCTLTLEEREFDVVGEEEKSVRVRHGRRHTVRVSDGNNLDPETEFPKYQLRRQ